MYNDLLKGFKMEYIHTSRRILREYSATEKHQTCLIINLRGTSFGIIIFN